MPTDTERLRKALRGMLLLFEQRPPAAVPTAPTQTHESGMLPVAQACSFAHSALGDRKDTRSPEDRFIEHAYENAEDQWGDRDR
jgi:hypothetical protein